MNPQRTEIVQIYYFDSYRTGKKLEYEDFPADPHARSIYLHHIKSHRAAIGIEGIPDLVW